MMTSDRPLWRLLAEFNKADSDEKRPLSCAECFTVLECLSDIFTQDDPAGTTIILKIARQHYTTCPDCYDYYQNRLQQMELIEAAITNGPQK
jgi:hypothetical protein